MIISRLNHLHTGIIRVQWQQINEAYSYSKERVQVESSNLQVYHDLLMSKEKWPNTAEQDISIVNRDYIRNSHWSFVVLRQYVSANAGEGSK